MSNTAKILQLKFDVPDKEGIGKACILVYETRGGFSLVVTAGHGGDADIFLTKSEFGQLKHALLKLPK